jgi:L-fuconolactonase
MHPAPFLQQDLAVMKIDSHQHFWTFTGNEADYVWMTGEYAVLGRDFGIDALRPLLKNVGFSGTVAIQAREMRKETDYLLDLAAAHPEIKAVVGWLDLCTSNIECELEHYANRTKLKGLRMLIHDRPNPDFAMSDAHLNGVSKLAKFGLTYDLLLKPPHLPAAIRLVDRLPNQMFVVDHIAKPDIRHHIMEPWRSLVVELSRRPNVYCKLSSIITQADWQVWKDADILPFLDIVIEAFGADRIMVGSDWPVCTCAADFGATMGLFDRWSKQLSMSEQGAFMGGNCTRFYGIEE